MGFPGGSMVENPPTNAGDAGDAGSVSELGIFPGGGNSTHSVFLPGKSYGQRSLVGYSPWGCRVWHDLLTEQPKHTYGQWGGRRKERVGCMDSVTGKLTLLYVK